MNGTAKQIVISLALSSRFSVEFMDEVYQGIKIACEAYQVDLIGGDTTSSHSGLIINVTAIGTANSKKLVYRSGAKVGDIVVVTGDLGGALMGLHLLEREKRVFKENPSATIDLQGYEYILQRQLRPEARKDIIEIMDGYGVQPTSMIDISDGLSSEALHLSKKSNVGIAIYSEKIPLDTMTYDTAQMFNIDPVISALNGGEDYEFLMTFSPADFEKIKNQPDFTEIGFVQELSEGNVLITKLGNKFPLQAQGWNHFTE
jgi:thiamine-monophosphate kinase